MSDSLRKAGRSMRERWLRAGGWIVVGLIGLVFFIWAVRPESAPAWTGFGPSAASGDDTSKTLWDWLELLAVPAALLLAAYWFTRPRSAAQVTSGRTTGAEQWGGGSEEGWRVSRLQTYLDQLTQLILDHNLGGPDEEREVRRIARAQTLTVLSILDGPSKGTLLRFLHEAGLIHGPEPTISLAGADLGRADLTDCDLREADLGGARLVGALLIHTQLAGANLTRADLTRATIRQALPTAKELQLPGRAMPRLQGVILDEAVLEDTNLGEADLSGASMRSARLIGIDLHDAILRDVQLQNATLTRANLKGANLKRANLSGADLAMSQLHGAKLTGAVLGRANLSNSELWQANLREADLVDANLSGARLTKAFLYRATLRGASLKGASLAGANLSGADLTDATLDGADLSGVYLSSAKVTSDQLARAASLEGAVMPELERRRVAIGAADASGERQYYYYQVAPSEDDK